MTILLLFLLGASLGGLTSFATRTRHHQRHFINLSVGIIGAFAGGFGVSRVIFGAAARTHSSDPRILLLAAVTATGLLAALTILRRLSDRRIEKTRTYWNPRGRRC